MLKTTLLTGLAALASLTVSVAQSFNFDTGTDAGLLHYDPLSALGVGGTFAFPGGNTYQISAPSSSPFTGVAGPARAGAYYPVAISDFSVSVDVVAWNSSLVQGFGPAARMQQPGLGTTDAYGLTYINGAGVMVIGRFDNEVGTGLAQVSITLNPALDYRMVFTGVGSTLTGSVYALTDLSTPLATVSTTDTTYTSGFGGILLAATVSLPTQAVDATFDNLSVTAVPEPGEYAAIAGAVMGGFVLWRRRQQR